MNRDEVLKIVTDAREKGELADLSGAYMSGADMSGADLRCAYLSGASLSRANLRGADLSGANLSRANLSGASLSMADLLGADLRGAKLDIDRVVSMTSILPDGQIVGYKKVITNNGRAAVCKLIIPPDAKRSNATGRKCRCNKARVASIVDNDGVSHDTAVSKHDRSFTYRVGEMVTVDNFDDDRWNECSTGIHFFITELEAKEY